MQATQSGGPLSRRADTLDPHVYTVAWIAPLEIEAQAALHLLDVRHQGRFPVSRGDDYVFHAGNMLGHNIVIATLPTGQEYGTGSAAALASQVKKFFPNLWFGLLVGVAAGLPDLSRSPARDIRLGDVLVGLPEGDSAGLIAYDLGKETEDGFEPLRRGHALAVTEPIIQSAIGSIKLKAPCDAEEFLPFYETIRNKEHATGVFADPGQDRDKLFWTDDDGTDRLVERARRPDSQRTRVWYGPIGSGDKLLKNAQRRNELRDKYGVIGVEMEAAGTMNRIPVGVIRGVCDYGDKHKNKEWQPYAAAMAAAYGKAVLFEIPPRDLGPSMPSKQTVTENATNSNSKQKKPVSSFKMINNELEGFRQPCYHIQLAKNTRFTGRTAVLDALEKKLFGQEPCQRTALVGLGGVGKTQIALHLAYRVKEQRPEYSIFWVPIISANSAQQAYVEIAKKLGVEKRSNDEDIRELVCRHLSSAESGKWLLIVDNADDQELVFGSAENGGIDDFLPRSDQGSILLTTRSRQVAVEFAQADVVDIEQMSRQEAIQLLAKSLPQKQMMEDEALITELLEYLTYLPLAITQAAAYLNRTKAPIHKYLSLLRGAKKDIPSVLGQEFRDNTRYRESRNAVATTWLVSFDQIEKSNKTAVELLSFIAYIEPKAIPQSIMPRPRPGLGSESEPEFEPEPDETESEPESDDLESSEELESAIGELCGYSFLVRRGDSDMFDMHSLVHMAMGAWTKARGRGAQIVGDAMSHLADIFPSHEPTNRELWREYLPHALRLLYGGQGDQAKQCRHDLLSSVGRCLEADRRYGEAVQCFEEVCKLEEEEKFASNSSQLSSMHWLAVAYLSFRRIKKSIEIMEHVVAIRRETLDDKDHDLLDSEYVLAKAYLDDRQIRKAMKMLEHINAIEREMLDEKDADRLKTEHELARAYLDDWQIEKGIEILEHVVAIRRETLDEKDQDRLTSQQVLASAYFDDGQIKKAIKILTHVVAMRKNTLDEKDIERLRSEHELASVYVYDGRVQEAIILLEHVVAIKSQIYAEDDPSLHSSMRLLTRAREQLEAEWETSEDESEASGCGQEMETGQVDVATLSASVDSLIEALDRLHL